MNIKNVLLIIGLGLVSATIQATDNTVFSLSQQLITAAKHNNIEALRTVLGHKDIQSFINEYDKDHMTALHHAFRNDNEEIALMLQRAGANLLYTKDPHGVFRPSPVSRNNSESKKNLPKHKHEVVVSSVAQATVPTVYTQGLTQLLTQPDGIAQLSQLGEKLIAATTAQQQIARGNQIAARYRAQGKNPFEGVTPLHTAAFGGDKAKVQQLIAAGTNINAKDIRGKTPLDCARVKGYTEIEQLLIENGALPSTNASTSSACKPEKDAPKQEAPKQLTKKEQAARDRMIKQLLAEDEKSTKKQQPKKSGKPKNISSVQRAQQRKDQTAQADRAEQIRRNAESATAREKQKELQEKRLKKARDDQRLAPFHAAMQHHRETAQKMIMKYCKDL